ncbi:hypothetical protein Hypma_010534 [Hypsizygus marmoreus]|uniref:Uncharacterized protein n=1 Tax=Hypsizygus marmoreus TaxID=39966 RepID=A0A369JMG1_HYPMA|nr:hypothetical protein Hypma_010534 [Hypsizygus marmoreus]
MDIGQAICELNSMLGIPQLTVNILAMYATLCGACNCFIENTSHLMISQKPSSPIDAAFLEWNSKLGIFQDVWALINTAFVYCDVCHLCCFFNGDHAHCGPDGCCNDGDENITVIATEEEEEKRAMQVQLALLILIMEVALD